MDYRFKLTGKTPLIMHADNIAAGDELNAWRKDPANKDLSVKGDDRSPPWTWSTYLYSDGDVITVPSETIMACLRDAGKTVKIQGNKTFKSATQSQLLIKEIDLPLLVDGATVAIADIQKLLDKPFPEQAAGVEEFGFSLNLKRVKVASSKNLRVRPIFDTWSVEGNLTVRDDALLTEDKVKLLFRIAGEEKGLLDWRPGAPCPGPYGTFSVSITKVCSAGVS